MDSMIYIILFPGVKNKVSLKSVIFFMLCFNTKEFLVSLLRNSIEVLIRSQAYLFKKRLKLQK